MKEPELTFRFRCFFAW